MTTQSRSFQVAFGALCPPLEEQLREQGLALNTSIEDQERLQRDINDVARLGIRGVITEAERDRARKRLLRIIRRSLKSV